MEETTKTEYSYSAPVFEYLKDASAETGIKSKTTAGTAITSETKFENFPNVNGTSSFYLLDALKNDQNNDTKGQKRTGALTTVDYMKGVSNADNAKGISSKKGISSRTDPISEEDYSAANEVFTSALMNGTDYIYTDTFIMTAALQNFTAASTLPVDVRIVMNGQGNIKAYFKNHLDASAKKQGNEYRLMLTLDAKEGAVQADSSSGASEDGSENTTKESKTAGDTTTSTESTSVTRHSYVNWGNPQITKDTSKDVWEVEE